MSKLLACRRSLLVRGLIILVTSAVCGCGLVDSVGPRAVHYNDEVADSKSGAILLNIIRAAYSMPLQFTDLSQFTAGAAADGNIGGQTGASIPVPMNHLANLMPRTATVSPQITLGGRLNATSSAQGANLNTQEFYRGLQTPLTNKQVHFYLTKNATTLNDWELLSLFIADITVYGYKDPPGQAYQKTLYGRADTPDNFYAFVGSIYSLVDKGLTMVEVKAHTKGVGPQLTAIQASDPRLLAALVTSSTAEKKGLSLVEVDKTKFQLNKAVGTDYQFCFGPKTGYHRTLSTDFRTEMEQDIDIALFPTRTGHLIRQFTIPKQYYACGRKKPDDPLPQDLQFTTRSLEGIFYFLGEMVRTELGLGIDETPTSLEIPIGHDKGEAVHTSRLFSVQRRRPSKGDLGVKYKGQWFSVEVDPTGKYDSSSRVLQILADLWALQSSAKDFPASNVVTIANP